MVRCSVLVHIPSVSTSHILQNLSITDYTGYSYRIDKNMENTLLQYLLRFCLSHYPDFLHDE